MTSLLATEGLTKHFAGLVANDAIDFNLEARSVRCVIGPNGAGKTTFISMISGHLRPHIRTHLLQGQRRYGTVADQARAHRHRTQIPDADRVRQLEHLREY